MKMTTKRFWAVLIVAAMLISMLPAMSFAAKPNDLKTEGGILLVEAEDLKFEKGSLAKTKNKKMFSGGYALQAVSGDKDAKDAELEADIDLSFTADVDGHYAIWVRNTANTVGSTANSVYMSLNGEQYSYTALRGEPEVPNWSKIATIPLKAGAVSNVRLRTRQTGPINLDVFYFTNVDGYTPSDEKLGMDNLIGFRPRPTPTPITIDAEKMYASIEAEDMDYDKAQFIEGTDADASGKTVLQPANDDKNTPGVADTAGIDLTFIAPESGSWNVWARAKTGGNSTKGNSVFLSKGEGASYGYFALNGTPENYEWTKIATLAVVGGETGSVRLSRRQGSKDIKIDRFVITKDPAFLPSGKDDVPGATGEMKLPEDLYEKPPVSPEKGEHPRLWLHKEDIPTIKANMEKEQNANAVAAQKKYLEKKVGITSNFSNDLLFAIQARAFDYVINGNEESGREAYDMYMDTVMMADYSADNFAVREYGGLIYIGSMVYDWCYNMLTQAERDKICEAIEVKCYSLSGGYPPKSGYITGHSSEGIVLIQMLAFAIASYDERPDIWNCIGGKFFQDYINPRNHYYQSHSYHQGSGYVNARFGWDIHNAVMMKKSLGIDPYNMEDMNMVLYEQIYNRRPDGRPIKLGDDYNEYGYSNNQWWGYDSGTMFYASNYFGDEYLKEAKMLSDPFFNNVASGNQIEISPAVFLIVNNPDLRGKTYDDLPLTKYYPSPNGAMTARTGWNMGYDSPDVVAYMGINELYGSNHDHLDSGSFQLYYKGSLAIDSGYYTTYGDEHHTKYQKQGIAHNIITVYDPNETVVNGYFNDGGYKVANNGSECASFNEWISGKFDTAKVLAHEFGPDAYKPEYSYISGDLTKSYSDKVTEALRSMVFMPLDDADHPGALIVMDKVTSKDASFAKNWLLHTEEEPKVEGNKTIVTRVEDGCNGRMVNETLLPKEADIEKIGGPGKQFWNGIKNVEIGAGKSIADAAEIGWGRVEVGPKTANQTDYFLNVMTVSDADTTAPDIVSTLIEDDRIAGAVFSDRAVVFNKHKERISESISFTLPEGERKVFVAGLKAGTWSINGTEVVASEDGGCVYAPVSGGNVTVSYVNENANKTFTQNKPEYYGKKIFIKVNNMYIYSDVDPVIIDDRTLLPMRAIFENLDAEVSWDPATATATAKNEVATVQITENSKTAYVNGEAKELDVPAMIIDGRFVVPVRFVSESMGAKVEWSNISEMVHVKYTPPAPPIDYTPTEPNAIKVQSYSDVGAEEGNGIAKSIDGDLTTRWANQCRDYSSYGIYDLGAEYTLDRVKFMFMNSAKRKTFFRIHLSSDGDNWTQFIGDTKDDGVNVAGDFKSDGLTPEGEGEDFDLKGEKARYVKIEWAGSSAGEWASLLEIVFFEKK